MNADFAIYLLIILFVVFRICSRAYVAFSNGYRTWPILAALAGIYVIVAVLRIFTGMQSTVFIVISLACILLSQFIFRASNSAG